MPASAHATLAALQPAASAPSTPSVGGAILAAFDDAEPGELFVEARARGAAPMLRVGAGDILEIGTDPAVLVVSDETIAEQLGVPRL